MATAITFAAVLLLIVPWYVPWRARTALRRKLIDEAGPLVYKKDDYETVEAVVAKLCLRLTTQGMVCRYLAKCPVDGEFELTNAGQRLAAHIRAKLYRLVKSGG
jgi:hypothetical protein